MRQLTWKHLQLVLSTRRSFETADRQVIGIWLALRLLTCLWVALLVWLMPIAQREPSPLAALSSTWFDRTLIAPWERWDATYYVRIVAQGYRSDDGTASFHPLLAWLAMPLAWISGSPLLALVLVSSLAGLLLLLSFERLAAIDLAPDESRTATLLLAFSPLAFVLFIPYTESLCLLWITLCLLGARRRVWWLAGLAGGLAALTRQQGVFLIIPLAWELWEAAGRRWRAALATWPDWLALALVPAGLVVWLVYRAVALHDLSTDFSNPQALIFSLVISPSTTQVVPVQQFLWPWQALGLALTKLWRVPDYGLVINLTLGLGFVVMLALAWRRMRLSYRLYSLAIVLISFSYHTGPFYPYIGLPRHLLLAVPVFIGLAPLLRPPRARLLLMTIGLLGILTLLFLYETHGWIP